jgi:hypothetical protein
MVKRFHAREGKGAVKPEKEAVEAILRLTKTARSSSLYRDLARKVRFQGCTDPTFVKLRTIMQQWFG